jgi:hypothetical protein
MIFFEDAYNEAKKHEDEYFIFLQEYFNDPTLKKTTKKYWDRGMNNNVIF